MPQLKQSSTPELTRNVEAQCLDEWREEICNMFTSLSLDTRDMSPFVGHADRTSIGDLHLTNIRAGGQVVERSDRDIKCESTQQYFLILQRSGECDVYSQDGDGFTLYAGDAILVNPQIPYILNFDRPNDQTCIQMPSDDLRDRICEHDNLLFGRKIDRGDSVTKILNAAVDDLTENAGSSLVELNSSIEMFYDVVAGCMRRISRRNADGIEPPRINAFNKLVGFVVRNHASENLSSAGAALELGVSLRTLSRLCVENGTTFGKLVLNARLTAAAHALRVAGGDAKGRITHIAYKHGFADLSHFSKCFKAKYGMSPANFVASR